jgi:hypothetical protein
MAPISADKATMEDGVVAVVTIPDDEVMPPEDIPPNSEVAAMMMTMIPDGAYNAAVVSPCDNKAHNAVVGVEIEVGPGDRTHKTAWVAILTMPGDGNHKAAWAATWRCNPPRLDL